MTFGTLFAQTTKNTLNIFFMTDINNSSASNAPKGTDEQQNRDNMPNFMTRDNFMHTLENMGCQIEDTNEEEQQLVFLYQGEHILANVSNDSVFINLWDLWWYDIPLDDIDSLSVLRKAINEVNCRIQLTLVYSVNPESNRVGVHSKQQILFHPSIDEKEDYLRFELGKFFDAKRIFLLELEKENMKKDQKAE